MKTYLETEFKDVDRYPTQILCVFVRGWGGGVRRRRRGFLFDLFTLISSHPLSSSSLVVL